MLSGHCCDFTHFYNYLYYSLPRLRQIIPDSDMANVGQQMQNVMQNPEVLNNLVGMLMENLGGAAGGNLNPGQDASGNPNPQ